MSGEQDVTAVVSALTKRQKDGLIHAWRSPAGRMQVSEACAGATLRALEDARLVDDAFSLTSLGIAVRAHLLSDTPTQVNEGGR